MPNGFGKISEQIAETLKACFETKGIQEVVYSPGFRNSKLISGLAESDTISLLPIIDERGAGFVCLGASKRQRKAAAIIVTSGTAAGNLLPAIMESDRSLTPMLVVTADRSRNELNRNSNQATIQEGIFKNFVRYEANIEIDHDIANSFATIAEQISKSISLSAGPIPGPVHINLRMPNPASEQIIELGSEAAAQSDFIQPVHLLKSSQLREIADNLSNNSKSAIFVGPYSYTPIDKSNIAKIAETTKSILVTEPVVGAEFTEIESVLVVDDPSVFVENTLEYALFVGFDFIGRSALEATSKGIVKLDRIANSSDTTSSKVRAHRYFMADVSASLEELSKLTCDSPSSDDAFSAHILDCLDSTRHAGISRIDENLPEISEPFFHHEMQKHWHDSDLLIGNSMAVRDFNRYTCIENIPRNRIFSNRGLSGIDGLLHTSLGLAINQKSRLCVVVGDLTFQHDLSAINALKHYQSDASIEVFVLNNAGGEIFRRVAPREDELLTTPMTVNFEMIAKSADLSFARITTKADLRRYIETRRLGVAGIRIVEVVVSAKANEIERLADF